MRAFKAKPIGFVKIMTENRSISELIINKELTDELDGIEDFSHLYVLYWMDKLGTNQHVTKIHPWGNDSLPIVGIFATRTQYRLNPIGLTLVELLRRDGNVLKVKGLDAFDGTPIVDIKPFDFWDASEYAKVKVPKWWIDARPEDYSHWRSVIRETK